MIWVFLYFVSCALAFCGFAYLNRTHEWITKTSVRYDELQGVALFFGTVFWPVALIVIGIYFFFKWIIQTFIPD